MVEEVSSNFSGSGRKVIISQLEVDQCTHHGCLTEINYSEFSTILAPKEKKN